MKSDTHDVLGAVELLRAALRKMHQNLFWAVAYNVRRGILSTGGQPGSGGVGHVRQLGAGGGECPVVRRESGADIVARIGSKVNCICSQSSRYLVR